MTSLKHCFVAVLVVNAVFIGFYWSSSLRNHKSGIVTKTKEELYLLTLSSSYAKNHTFIRTLIHSAENILQSKNPIVIYDIGPCYWVAQGALVFGRTGGEYVWCQSVIGQLIELGRDVYVTNSPNIAKILTSSSHRSGRGTVLFSHWGWQDILEPSNWLRSSDRKRYPSTVIGRNCVIKFYFTLFYFEF